ncbi:uncharacterized protein LOC124664521 [Lolium rigidum]|uniref:uncharacterized protein LOC124664521 n=1 Tax=Lolium rigidum TaxID=89674 RepID=UPI001F5CF15F|nr:uncharacterized protein LOC124664521 [Lolium rigidum]
MAQWREVWVDGVVCGHRGTLAAVGDDVVGYSARVGRGAGVAVSVSARGESEMRAESTGQGRCPRVSGACPCALQRVTGGAGTFWSGPCRVIPGHWRKNKDAADVMTWREYESLRIEMRREFRDQDEELKGTVQEVTQKLDTTNETVTKMQEQMTDIQRNIQEFSDVFPEEVTAGLPPLRVQPIPSWTNPEMFPTRMLGSGVWGGPIAAGGPPGEMASDDDRSVAADSWSIKSDYGSTLDDEQCYADTAEVLLASSRPSSGSAAAPSACSSSLSAHHSSDFSFDKDVPDVVPPMLGLQSYHDGAYAEDLANYNERSHADEWFGTEVMDVLVDWTKNLRSSKDLPGCSVLDIGSGRYGFSDLTGIDYSEAAIELARNLAIRDGFEHINFLVDDVLESKLERRFELVMDEGTLDVGTSASQ